MKREVDKRMDRREFLKLFGGGAAIAGLGLLAAMTGCKKPPEPEPVPDMPPEPPPGPEPGGEAPPPTNQPPQG